MEIISIGNQLRRGEYIIHSRFKSAINFISGDNFVFVVNESVGAGPVNIVINGEVPLGADLLEVGETHLRLNGIEFGFDYGCRYDSKIDMSSYNNELFTRNLGIVERTVIEKAPEKSLAYLLGGRIEEGFGSFDKECRRKIRAGAEQILYGDLIGGVRMIKGLGQGLTPSGDDFNSGLLIAMNVVEHRPLRFRKTSEVNIIDQVYNAAKGKNLFTNSFLECAASGNLFYKFRELIRALQIANVKEIINSTELVMTMGETSGSDQLTGFLIGMKRFLI